MSPLARSLLALAVVALLHGACAVWPTMYPPLTGLTGNAGLIDNCARYLIGRTSDLSRNEGATAMPVHVTQRRGWIPIPDYGLLGLKVVGQRVRLCNMGNRGAPRVILHDGQVNSKDLKMFVELFDGDRGPANMNLYVDYYLERLWPPLEG